MGEFRKKVKFGFFKSLLYIIIAFICLLLAVFIRVKVYDSLQENLFDRGMYYLSIGLAIVAILIVLRLFIASKRMSLELYSNGIKVKGRAEPLMYSECSSFYFIPMSVNRIRGLVLKAKYDSVMFSGRYLGDDFYDIFQKDYIATNKDAFIAKIDSGQIVKFGVLTKFQAVFIAIFQTKGIAGNLEFKDNIAVDKDGVTYRQKHYPYSQLNVSYDTKTGNILVQTKDSATILSSYYTYFEMGEMFFFLLEHYMKDNSISKTDYMLTSDTSANDFSKDGAVKSTQASYDEIPDDTVESVQTSYEMQNDAVEGTKTGENVSKDIERENIEK